MHREPDPRDEYFDVVSFEGEPTGEVKRRSDVHADGDWHCAFHCWVVLESESGEPAVLFQRRSFQKDTHPDQLDVAVGGHYRSGEGFEEVVREIEEELGISPPPAELVPIGRRRAVGTGPTWIDREIEDVYVHVLESGVKTLRPAFEEISALDLVLLRDIEALFASGRAPVESLRFDVREGNVLSAGYPARIDRNDFIPVTDDYWLLGSRAAAAVLRGCEGVRLNLW